MIKKETKQGFYNPVFSLFLKYKGFKKNDYRIIRG